MKLSAVLSIILPLAAAAKIPPKALQKHDASFVPDHVLRITSANHSFGCDTPRLSTLVNGTSPGPAIHLTPGKISWIRVYNDMTTANLTMHWHGLSQRMAPFADGTPQTSQWPIPPLHFFDYEVFPEACDAGTYFYHSHVGFQAVSASGPLIVQDAGAPPYKYDAEQIVELTDYFPKTDAQVETGLSTSPFTWTGETQAVLLNGIGACKNVQANGTKCPIPTFDLEYGKTYRYRFIGGTALSLVSLGIEGHNMTVIAADARYTQQQQTSYLQIGTGQRFDVLIKAKSQDQVAALGKKAFYMKFQSKERPAVYTGYALFRYNNKIVANTTTPNVPSIVLTNSTSTFMEYTLQPLYANGFPTAKEVTRRVYITVSQQGAGGSFIRWYDNKLNWTESSEPRPYLPDIYKYGQAAIPNFAAAQKNGGWDPVTKAWPAKIGEVLEIVLQNTGSLVANNGELDIHPWHAHAGHYYDIGSGWGTYNAAKNEAKLAKYHPVLRDTTYMYRSGANTTAGAIDSWRAWRIRVDDAGVYMIHCHILQHMIMGMQTAWVFGNAADIKKIPFAMAQGYLTYGGSAYGNSSYDPQVYHYYQSHPQQPWE